MWYVTSSKAMVANAYAIHDPWPALAKTTGTMRAGVAEGAMFATLCATTSMNDRQSRRNPPGCAAMSSGERSSGIEYPVERRETSVEIGVVDHERRLDAQ